VRHPTPVSSGAFGGHEHAAAQAALIGRTAVATRVHLRRLRDSWFVAGRLCCEVFGLVACGVIVSVRCRVSAVRTRRA
jgi:hypothetical protein